MAVEVRQADEETPRILLFVSRSVGIFQLLD